jgi:branched-chain amino acid transport system ATP-binding protein
MTERLEVDDLTVVFGGTVAVDHVGFAVEPGQIFGVVGPNGAGKTTLLNGISRLVPLAGGAVRLGPTRLSDLKSSDLAAIRIGRTFQAAEVFNEFRVIDYLLLGRYVTQPKSMVRAALQMRFLQSVERRDAQSAQELLERYGLGGEAHAMLRDLPYGRRKLVDVLRVIMMRPALVLLDEPTSGSATDDRVTMRKAIAHLRELETSAIVIDHDVRFVLDICDRLLVMNFGKELGVGDPHEVMRRPEIQAAYTGLEASETRSP